MSASLTAICGILLAVVLYHGKRVVTWLIRKHRINVIVDQLPGSRGEFFMGHLREFKRTSTEEYVQQMIDKWPNRYKTAYKVWMGPIEAVVRVCHPDTVRKVLKTAEPKPLGGKSMTIIGYDLDIDWLGESIILTSGAKWFRNRRLMTNAFHFDILRKYLSKVNECTSTFLDLLAIASTERSVVLDDHILMLTLDVLLKCAFSYDGNVQAQGYENEYALANKLIVSGTYTRVIKPWLIPDFIYRLTSDGRLFFKKVAFVEKFLTDVIAARKATVNSNNCDTQLSTSNKKTLDFLDTLLTARDDAGQGLSDDEIRQEVKGVLAAGHDTTAANLSWAFYNLARHPEIQEKVRQEVNSLLSMRDSSDILWEDLSKLEYLGMCLKESMRLHTVVPVVVRELSKEMEIDGILFPPGTTIHVCLNDLHHNKHVWDKPYEYNPERFRDPTKIDGFQFVPFSAGPRNCLGQHFAMNEMKVVIARVLHRFKLELVEGYKVELDWPIIMKPNNGVEVKLTPCSQ